MCIDPVPATLAIQRINEVRWPSSVGPDEFIAYGFVKGTLYGYPAVRLAPVKCQEFDVVLIVSLLTSADDDNWL